jgi:hypothetical protein
LRLPWTAPVDIEATRDYADVLVRAGYLDDAAVVAEVSHAVRHDNGVKDPDYVAAEIVGSAVAELESEQRSWPPVTDYECLQRAFAEMRAAGVLVLEYVDDHWAATSELTARDDRGEAVRGIAWFTPSDVWHSVRHSMLELNLWHGDTANVAPGDELLDDMLALLKRHGLGAHFDEGRIEMAVRWQRRRAEAP